jgi:Flp pilus assembly protein TadG
VSLRRTPDRRRERGVVIIWTAFFLLMMLGFVAIGIDIAKLMATRTQLQNAADAAALAGASAVNGLTGAVVQDTATARAQAIAALNKAFVDAPEALVLASSDVSFPTPDRVAVTVRRDASSGGAMVTHVAQVLGINSLDVKASAIAKVDTAGGVCEKLVPMGAIEPPAGGFQVRCDTTYALKLDPASVNSPGNFQLLDFPECGEGPCQGQGGAAEIRCLVANGYACCMTIGDMVPTQPGNKSGPFLQGINDRWDGDTDQREGICFTDYHGNGNRIVNVPILKDFDPNGKKLVRIEGFAAFFLSTRPTGGALYGQFMKPVTVGTRGGGGSTGMVSFVIRLVK